MDGKSERGVIHHNGEDEMACPACGRREWMHADDAALRPACKGCLAEAGRKVRMSATGRVRTVRHVQRD